jgi:sugar O-acyltransferase (sialic acid O-acetyltransferase NeuD family)
MIVGCGGHGRVIADIAECSGANVARFLDDAPSAAARKLKVTGPVRDEVLRHLVTHRFVVGIGDSAKRRELSEFVLESGGELAILVHPSAILAADVEIGDGSVVMAGSVVNTGSRIGRFAVVNTGAIVDHDNTVEDNVHISPGCSLAGWVTCKRDAFIGTGATIIPRVVVGEGAYVAAGSTVIRDVPPDTLVAGCPAVAKKTFESGDG